MTIMSEWKTIVCGALGFLFSLAALADVVCREETRPPFHGIAAMDAAWPLHVRELPKKEGDCPRYVLQKDENQDDPEHQYAAILPVLLDGVQESDYSGDLSEDEDMERMASYGAYFNSPQEHRLGFIAYRSDDTDQNNALLLDSRGKTIIPDRFMSGGVQSDDAGALLGLEKAEPRYPDKSHTWLYFKDGRLVRRAPRWYETSGRMTRKDGDWHLRSMDKSSVMHVTIKTPPATPGGFSPITHGVLRMTDMHELLPPIYADFGVMYMRHAPATAAFIFTREIVPGKPLTRIQIYDEDLQPIELPEFHDFKYHYHSHSVAFLNRESMDCRLYSVQPGSSAMYAIIDAPLPLDTNGNCPDFDYDILVSSTETKSRIFIREKSGKAVLSAELPGKVVARKIRATRNIFIVQGTQEGRPMYRVFNGAGTLLRDEWFEEYLDLGCGFLRVRRAGEWYSLGLDGSLSTKMGYPFSC
jgi:hypothetical protein